MNINYDCNAYKTLYFRKNIFLNVKWFLSYIHIPHNSSNELIVNGFGHSLFYIVYKIPKAVLPEYTLNTTYKLSASMLYTKFSVSKEIFVLSVISIVLDIYLVCSLCMVMQYGTYFLFQFYILQLFFHLNIITLFWHCPLYLFYFLGHKIPLTIFYIAVFCWKIL